MKTTSLFLALINSLLAGLLLTYNLSSPQLHVSSTLWLLIESLAALSVIMIGVLTWFTFMPAMNTRLLLIGGLYLVVLGAVAIVWTYHLAILSGHMQYHMVVSGASLAAQGLASLLGFSAEAQTMTNT